MENNPMLSKLVSLRNRVFSLSLLIFAIQLIECFAQSTEEKWFRDVINVRKEETPEENVASIAKEIENPEEYAKLKRLLETAALNKSSSDTTKYAVRVVGRLKKSDAPEILKNFVNSDSFSIRVASYQALAEVGNDQALTLLEKRIQAVEDNILSSDIPKRDDAVDVLRAIAFMGGQKAKKIYFEVAERILHQLDNDPGRKQEMKAQFEELWRLMRENDAKKGSL